VIVAAPLGRAWEALVALPPLRDAIGLLVLEEADDDTRTAALRYRGATITATLVAAGEQTRLELSAPALDGAALDAAAKRMAAALAPRRPGRLVAASSFAGRRR
jgi:hypothetical protein